MATVTRSEWLDAGQCPNKSTGAVIDKSGADCSRYRLLAKRQRAASARGSPHSGTVWRLLTITVTAGH